LAINPHGWARQSVWAAISRDIKPEPAPIKATTAAAGAPQRPGLKDKFRQIGILGEITDLAMHIGSINNFRLPRAVTGGE
jgi:hypothetical protein